MNSQHLAQMLAERVRSDLRAARQLEPHSDISDHVIGFYAQQVVEKSLKAVLALDGKTT